MTFTQSNKTRRRGKVARIFWGEDEDEDEDEE
jgi:hypothetical protein